MPSSSITVANAVGTFPRTGGRRPELVTATASHRPPSRDRRSQPSWCLHLDLGDVRVAVGGAGTGPRLCRRPHAGAQTLVERAPVEPDAHLVKLRLRVGAELEPLL